MLTATLADGTPIPEDATTYTTAYTAATNDFTNAGGDGYVELQTVRATRGI